jgi:hypothetical protein
VSTQKFEDRLLGELKQIVLERAAKRPGPVAHRPAWRSRPVLVGAVAALAAGVVVGPPLLRADEASAAWAVTESDDGWITVTITEFKDADGLGTHAGAAGRRRRGGLPSPGHAMPGAALRVGARKEGTSPEDHAR